MKSAGSKEEKTNSKPKKNSVTCNNDSNKNMDGIEDTKNVNASKRLSGSSFSVTSYTKKVTLPPGWCVKTVFRRVFGAQPNIYNGAFLRKMLHRRYLTWF